MPTKKKTPAKSKKTAQKERFMTFRFSVETVYWLILLLLILALAVWVLQLTMQTQNIYNKIQYINSTSEVTPSKTE